MGKALFAIHESKAQCIKVRLNGTFRTAKKCKFLSVPQISSPRGYFNIQFALCTVSNCWIGLEVCQSNVQVFLHCASSRSVPFLERIFDIACKKSLGVIRSSFVLIPLGFGIRDWQEKKEKRKKTLINSWLRYTTVTLTTLVIFSSCNVYFKIS